MHKAAAIFVVLFLIHVAVATKSCIIHEKKDDPEIHVIHFDDPSKESSEPDIISLNLPDKRKREVWSSEAKFFCKDDKDCAPGEMCVAYLRCLKVSRKESSPFTRKTTNDEGKT